MPNAEELIKKHRTDDVHQLSLQWHGMPQATWMIEQVEGWQRLKKKVPSWAAIDSLHFPKRLSVEQCSSEQTAKYKVEVVRSRLEKMPRPTVMADITGGFGVDCSFLSRLASQAFYVERDTALCETMKHNAPLLQLSNLSVINEDGTEWLKHQKHLDLIYIDPARRSDHGKKLISMTDCEPNVVNLLPLLREKARCVLLKLSPMLDISLALKQLENHVEEVHIVASDGECKELLMLLDMQKSTETPIIICTDGKELLRFTISEEAALSANALTEESYYASELGQFLFEPNATILKAGAFHTVAHRFGVQKLHPNTHLYTANAQKNDFPGRKFKIKQAVDFSKKELKSLMGRQVNLSVRNLHGTTDILRKKLKLHDGGAEYWFATTYFPSKKGIIICEKLP